MARSGGRLREVDARREGHGLVIYRASRLEALVAPLRQLLDATLPAQALAPQTVIAAHPGMRQWLQGALAREYGAGGIVANLDIVLPSAWIDRVAQQELGRQAIALPHYRREQLRWTLHAALSGDTRALGITDARLAAYLPQDAGGSADVARRRFQLADRLAHIYSQYLVYRPDWLRAWEQGQLVGAGRGGLAAATERELLAPLWRHVRARLGPHRADIVDELIARLPAAVAAADPGAALHVFGVGHLAPSELAVLRAYARRHLVAFYVPDPCREYWGGLARDLGGLRAWRAAEAARMAEDVPAADWSAQGHPLLADWGRLGQHFMAALADGDGDVLQDVRHWRDAAPARPGNRLERLQQSIRELDPGLMAVDVRDPAVQAAELADASLRVHACHTRLRELEVLRDQLLDAFAGADRRGGRLRPSDVVVMAPDIQAYVPLIPAVFGVAGNARERLPYHLADVAVARGHPLFAAFRRLLDVPGTRITAPQVVDLLALPDVSRRLGLDAEGQDELTAALRESRVAWALDGAFRARFDAPPIADHTFGWALDRLLAGYLMADAAGDEGGAGVTLADGSELAPLPSVEGPAAGQLGALDQLLGELQVLCDLATKSMPASAWVPVLERHVDALLRIDPMDPGARDAHALLLRFIRGIAAEPAAAGEDPPLHFAVVRDLLLAGLDAAPERQRFLMGGITFCGMVPQRAIPFQVVAVLGLNDGEFPRAASDAGLDLMARWRRLGDRDVRGDDRYLFLETVMSARRRLHLSYIGQGVRDGEPRNPAAPLAELLGALDAAARRAGDDRPMEWPWLVRHPLQPFDARYFDGADPRLYSYSAAFAAMHGDALAPAVPPFLAAADAAPAGADGAPPPVPDAAVTLRELAGYYRDPARQLLERGLHVSLDALADDRLPQDEPLGAGFPPQATVARRVFFRDGLARGAWEVGEPPAWLRLGGLMPSGRLGDQAWDEVRRSVDALLALAQALPGFTPAPPPAGRHAVDLELGPWRLTGEVADVFVTAAGPQVQWNLLRAFPGRGGRLKPERDLTFKDRVPMFLDWALLRLQTGRDAPAEPPAIRLRALVEGDDARWQAALDAWDGQFLAAAPGRRLALLSDLERRVAQLLAWWQEAQSTPRWYFPNAAWETIKAEAYPRPAKADEGAGTGDGAGGAAGVGATWIATHDGGVGERDYAPGYARLLAGDVDFAGGTPELAALHAFARRLQACISLHGAWAKAGAA